MIVTRCNMVENKSQSATSSAIPRWGFPESDFRQDAVADRIGDFLDGRTHGEELLHALYDHVLYEAIPERMRSLFKK
jgi:hypothetical protein